MEQINLKLKQASAVLGVPAKDLQNLVQQGVVRPARRRTVFWFNGRVLAQAKVAFYLKESLGTSSELLARFTEALSEKLSDPLTDDVKDICLRSRPFNGSEAVEIEVPLRALARELMERLPLASAVKDLPRGRKRAGWKKEFLRTAGKSAACLREISEEKILKAVREYRSSRKKPPEITVVARKKTKTA